MSSEFLRIAQDPAATEQQKATVEAITDFLWPSWDGPRESVSQTSEKLSQLESLNLQGCQLEDISPLTGLTNLKRLVLTDNRISDIGPLRTLINLESLRLNDNFVRDLSPLQSSKLKEFGARRNRIQSFHFLPTTLEYLDLSENEISSWDGLNSLTNLIKLEVSKAKIRNFDLLRTMARLRVLILDGNQIDNITGLNAFPEIRNLRLSDNSIRDISALSNLKSVTTLSLTGNRINDFSALLNLPNLRKLTLEHTLDFSFERLRDIPSLIQYRIFREQNLLEKYENESAWEPLFLHDRTARISKIHLTVDSKLFDALDDPPFGLDNWDNDEDLFYEEYCCVRNALKRTLLQKWFVHTDGSEGEYYDADVSLSDSYGTTRHVSFGIFSTKAASSELLTTVQEFLTRCKNPWLIGIGSGLTHPGAQLNLASPIKRFAWQIRAAFYRLTERKCSELTEDEKNHQNQVMNDWDFDIYVTKEGVVVSEKHARVVRKLFRIT
jgi:Leucine-rich repeat (LRR) protein